MATMPSRTEQLAQAVASLAPQVDELWVWLNGFGAMRPDCLERHGCRSVTGPDRGDAGKFYVAISRPHASEYMFTCDDDLIYPPDYVDMLVETLEDQEDEVGRPIAVGVHAARLRRSPPLSYRRDRDVRHCLRKDLFGVRSEHILGTGTLAFKASAIRLQWSNFENGIMADIWFALQAQWQCVPLRSVPRDDGWIRPAEPRPDDTLWNRMCASGERVHVAALQRISNWKLY